MRKVEIPAHIKRIALCWLTMAFLMFEVNSQLLQEGVLILKDSTRQTVRLFKKFEMDKAKTNRFDYIRVWKNEETGHTILPGDIKGFMIGKKTYKSLSLQTGKDTLHFFAELLESGASDLYYYGGRAFGQKEIYIFRKQHQPFYYISLEPVLKSQNDQSGVSANMPPDLRYNQQMNQLIHNFSNEKAFQNNFIRYFSDCRVIVAKLQQGWYFPSSISSIFKEYNTECQKHDK